MIISYDKCFLLHIIGNNRSCDCNVANYTLDSHVILNVKVFRYLGVLIDEKLSFVPHVKHIRVICYRLINLCFKIIRIKDLNTYLTFYKIYILPRIMYCSSVYGLCSKFNIRSVEKIQKYFTRRLFWRLNGFGFTVSYEHRLDYKLMVYNAWICHILNLILKLFIKLQMVY